MYRLFWKKIIFFFRIKICRAHDSSDVTMFDHLFMFKTDLEETFFSSKVFDRRLRHLLAVLFCHVILLFILLDHVSSIYQAARF